MSDDPGAAPEQQPRVVYVQTPAKRHPILKWGCLSVVALVVIIVIAAVATSHGGTTNASGGTTGGSSSGHTVRYLIAATNGAGPVDVTYTNAQGDEAQASGAAAPWDHTFTGVGALTSLYLSAQNQASAGDVSCTIWLDGKLFKANTSTGGYSIVTCSGSTGF